MNKNTIVKDIDDLSEEEISKLSLKQAQDIFENLGIDTDNINNSEPIQIKTSQFRYKLRQIEKRLSKLNSGHKDDK